MSTYQLHPALTNDRRRRRQRRGQTAQPPGLASRGRETVVVQVNKQGGPICEPAGHPAPLNAATPYDSTPRPDLTQAKLRSSRGRGRCRVAPLAPLLYPPSSAGGGVLITRGSDAFDPATASIEETSCVTLSLPKVAWLAVSLRMLSLSSSYSAPASSSGNGGSLSESLGWGGGTTPAPGRPLTDLVAKRNDRSSNRDRRCQAKR
jgi:hypothetical protein